MFMCVSDLSEIRMGNGRLLTAGKVLAWISLQSEISHADNNFDYSSSLALKFANSGRFHWPVVSPSP